MVRFGHIVWLLIVKIPKKKHSLGGAFFCAVWNGARDNVSLDSFRGDFCAPFGIKCQQCLSLGALSKGGFCRECFLCAIWNKMSAVAAQCLLSGCFSRGGAFCAVLIKFLSLPSQTRPNFAVFFIYCSIAIAAALFLRAYFALLFCRRHTAWGT